MAQDCQFSNFVHRPQSTLFVGAYYALITVKSRIFIAVCHSVVNFELTKNSLKITPFRANKVFIAFDIAMFKICSV